MWNDEPVVVTGFLNSTTNFNKNRNTHSVAPVVIRQVLRSGDDGVKLWGNNIKIICIVARLRGIEVQSLKRIYTIQDITGRMRAVHWFSTDEDDINTVMVYAKIYGNVATVKGEKQLRVFKIEPVTDVNEITFHYLHCIENRFKMEHNCKKSKIAENNTSPSAFGLTTQQTKVFNMIKASITEEGISREVMYSALKNYMTPMEFQQILDNLCGRAFIYSTLDENHFKVI